MWTFNLLIIILVAQKSSHSVHDIPDLKIRLQTIKHNRCIQRKRLSIGSISIHIVQPPGVLVLPDTIVTIDHGVMQPEKRVARAAVEIAHRTANSVVAVHVDTALLADRESLVVVGALASIHIRLGTMGRLRCVAVAGQTVGLFALARTDVRSEIGELAIAHAVAAQANSTEPLAREDGGLGKLSRVFGLVEPGNGFGEAAFVAERFFKGPEVGPVPHDELAVVVYVIGDGLVHLYEVFVAVCGAGEAFGRVAQETFHGVYELLLVRIVGSVPFGTGTWVAAGRRDALESIELGRWVLISFVHNGYELFRCEDARALGFKSREGGFGGARGDVRARQDGSRCACEESYEKSELRHLVSNGNKSIING